MYNERKIILYSRDMIGRNNYCDDLRIYALEPYIDGKYYSNKSSFTCACFIYAGFDIDWMNSYALKKSDLFEKVDEKDIHLADIVIWSECIGIVCEVENQIKIQLQEEGCKPSIITLEEAKQKFSGDPKFKRFKRFIS